VEISFTELAEKDEEIGVNILGERPLKWNRK